MLQVIRTKLVEGVVKFHIPSSSQMVEMALAQFRPSASDRFVAGLGVEQTWFPSEECWGSDFGAGVGPARHAYDPNSHGEQVFDPLAGEWVQHHPAEWPDLNLTNWVMPKRLVPVARALHRGEDVAMFVDDRLPVKVLGRLTFLVEAFVGQYVEPERAVEKAPPIPGSIPDHERDEFIPVMFETDGGPMLGYRKGPWLWGIDGELYEEPIDEPHWEERSFARLDPGYSVDQMLKDSCARADTDERRAIDEFFEKGAYARRECWNLRPVPEGSAEYAAIQEAFDDAQDEYAQKTAFPGKQDFGRKTKSATWIDEMEAALEATVDALNADPGRQVRDFERRWDLEATGAWVDAEQWKNARPCVKSRVVKDGAGNIVRTEAKVVSVAEQFEAAGITFKSARFANEVAEAIKQADSGPVPVGTVEVASKRSRASFQGTAVYIGGKWALQEQSPLWRWDKRNDPYAYKKWLWQQIQRRPEGEAALELFAIAARVKSGASVVLQTWEDKETGEIPAYAEVVAAAVRYFATK